MKKQGSSIAPCLASLADTQDGANLLEAESIYNIQYVIEKKRIVCNIRCLQINMYMGLVNWNGVWVALWSTREPQEQY